MRRRENIQKFYALKGGINSTEIANFQTDFFKYGAVLATAVTTAILVSAATTTAVSVTGAATTGISLSSTMTTGLSITGTCGGAGIDFGATSVTTGSLIDYVGITGKVSGYLFNGSMTTSTLTASTLIDDFSCSCASDGLAADTLRMLRRTWSGAIPNGTAAADFKMIELIWTSTYGTAATKGGTPMMISLDSNATINDSSANFTGLNVALDGMTLTSVANVYAIDITGKTGVDAGVHITTATAGISFAGTIANLLDITAAATTTYFAKFNAAAGCVIETDVEPIDDPSNGALGADGCIAINVAGDICYIPYFSILAS